MLHQTALPQWPLAEVCFLAATTILIAYIHSVIVYLLPPPDRGAEYCDESVSVCLCVCLSVRDHIFGIKRPIFIKFFVHVTYGRGSVLLWWRRDTLCTSGFMEYVIFAYKPRLLDVTAQL